MSRAQSRINQSKRALAALSIASQMDEYLDMIQMFVDEFAGMNRRECVMAVREACDIWLSSKQLS